MGDHALNQIIIPVRGCFGRRKYEPRIKNVEALVFHRSCIEIINGNDHEKIEVVLSAEAFLVPFHGFFQASHRMMGSFQISRFHINFEEDFTSRLGGETVFQAFEISCNHGKEVTRFGEGVLPDGSMSSVFQVFGPEQIPVGKQNRITF